MDLSEKEIRSEVEQAPSFEVSHEPDAKGTIDDARDMARLGKRQQFQVLPCSYSIDILLPTN
jgi:hypothetical protein